MSFWQKFFGLDSSKSSLPTSDLENNPEEVEPISRVQNVEIPHTLDLGWYYSEDKDELQMAKVAEKDRTTHCYVIGATGTGKTKFLQFLIQQDIEKGNGFGVIDPHGDLIEDIKGFLARRHYESGDDREIKERIILIDPTNPHFTATFNPLEGLPGISVPEQVNELISSFRKIWSDSWGVRMEDLMRNALIALGEAEFTLLELPPFLTQRGFRESVLQKVSHPIAQDYFKRFDTMTDRSQITWIEPVMNKINAFLSDPRIRQMFASPKSSFNLREIMDQKKALLIKLDKGKLKDAADLLGSLLMAKIQMAAFSRSNIPREKRIPFYLYIDEFQNFASESFEVILSEARKYGLSLIMAHQTLSQISEELRSLILGNAGLQVFFRVNRKDASLLAKEIFEYSGYEVKTVTSLTPKYWSFAEEWEHKTEELQNLEPRFCYVKHKIGGGVISIYTQEIEPPWEEMGIEFESFRDHVMKLPFGNKYLVPRKDLISSLEERDRSIKKLVQEEPKKLAKIPPKLSLVKMEEAAEEPPGEGRIGSVGSLPPAGSIALKKSGKEDGQAVMALSAEERVLLEFISRHPGMFVTNIYKELELSGYKGDKLKESLTEKGLITQEETREGKGGRLAKKLALTDQGTFLLKRSSWGGKGGDFHKYLQMMVKERAELYGWKAKIEERIVGTLENVDVGLSKQEVKVAVEISSMSRPGQEVENIRKCLEAGYDFVICICSEEKRLAAIKTEAKKNFTLRERERVRFCLPGRVKDFLQGTAPAAIVSENRVVSGQMTKQKQLLDTSEAAQYLGISKNTLYEWILQRKIPHVKVGRLVKFREGELKAWLDKRSQEVQKEGDFL